MNQEIINQLLSSFGGMAEFTEIHILEAAARCGIKSEDCCKAEVTVNCPFCDDKKRHMRLNTVKQVYYCPRCGAGGNSLTLFAKLTNTTIKQLIASLPPEIYSVQL